MKNHTHSRKLFLVLLTSVSVTATLSACNTTKKMIDGWTNDREPQRVEGDRRIPMNNMKFINNAQAPATPEPQAAAAPAPVAEVKPVETPQAMAVESPKRVPSFEENPYDYYDNEGNRVEPVRPEPAPVKNVVAQDARAQESAGSFFSRIFGLSDEPSEIEKLRQQPRKPLMDNAYPAPLAPAPVSQAAPQPMMPVAEQAPAPIEYSLHDEMAKPSQQIATTPVLEEEAAPAKLASQHVSAPTAVHEADAAMVPAVEVNEARKKPNWFERNFSSAFEHDLAKDEKDSQAAAAEENTEFPTLTSIPATPEQFEEVKEHKQQDMEDMQAAHMQAKQDSFALYNEPSSQEAKVPVLAVPAEPKSVPVTVETKPAAPSPVPAVDTVYSIENEKPAEGEVLLGHASAPVEASAKPVVAPIPAPANAPLTEEPAVAAAPEPAKPAAALYEEEAPKQNRWWEGWNLFSNKESAQQPVAAPSEDVMQDMPEASAPEPSETLKPMVAEPQPVPEPTPVMEAEAGAAAETSATESADALPSPEILKEMKMMPPSRYSGRLQSLSNNPQPY